MSKRKGLSAAITRREMLKGTGLLLGGLAMPGVLEACLTSSTSTPSGSIKIGYVSRSLARPRVSASLTRM